MISLDEAHALRSFLLEGGTLAQWLRAKGLPVPSRRLSSPKALPRITPPPQAPPERPRPAPGGWYDKIRPSKDAKPPWEE